MPDVLRKQVDMSFEEAVKRVHEALEAEEFSHLLTKGVHEIFKKKLGVENYTKTTFVLACAAPLAKMALDVSLDVGLLMPCSFLVYEDEDKVYVAHVSIMKAAVILDLAPADKMQPVIEETKKRIGKVWDRI
ncbi:MAG: hypothetical protein BAJATHORv1_20663 [Candidatus Thorarchaeota archaeon]|nr:MAG: hypothetical protein BAJATHORv1_20663 [Candidatus Thorarchaeota archaeon]